MQQNDQFFREVWPAIAEAVTGHRAGRDADVLPLLRRLGVRRGARVLDVPCGFGRHSILLARRGYRVTGVDFGPELLAQARAAWSEGPQGVQAPKPKRGQPIRRGKAGPSPRPSQLWVNKMPAIPPVFIRGDMRRLRFRAQFDLLLNLFTSFGYFGDAGDQRVLDSFHRALKPGGWLVLHTINRDFIVRHYRPHDLVRLPGFRLEQRSRLDWPTSITHGEWIVHWNSAASARRLLGATRTKPRSLRTLPRRGWTHLRVYSCHELVRMLERAGFRRVQSFGGFRGEPVSFDRRWLLLTAQR
jgi:SAM-dependent methyltransferase